MQIKGTIKGIYGEQVITGTFKKREFVVTTADNPEYPQDIKLEFVQEKCALLDQYKAGQAVVVEFNLNGRAWQDPNGGEKYFNTLQAWKISPQSQPAHGQPVMSGNMQVPPAQDQPPAQFQNPDGSY